MSRTADSQTEEELQALWDDYLANPVRGGLTEDLLARAYMTYAKRVCDRRYATLPNNVDYEEVLQYGRIGLLDAIRNFDPEKAKFTTYASVKIQFKITDGLRHADWLTRDTRRVVRTVQTAIAEMEKELHRTPSHAEVAERLGMTVQEVSTALMNHNSSHVSSLDTTLPSRGGEDSGYTLGSHLADLNSLSPDEEAEKVEEEALVRQAISHLPERDRQIIGYYYYEKLTLHNIGRILGVTESRVCQIHAKAIETLKAVVQQMTDPTPYGSTTEDADIPALSDTVQMSLF